MKTAKLVRLARDKKWVYVGTNQKLLEGGNIEKVGESRKKAKVGVLVKQLVIKTKATGKCQSAVAFTSGCPKSHMVMGRNTCSAGAVQCSLGQCCAVQCSAV